jgi:hypothetical protein
MAIALTVITAQNGSAAALGDRRASSSHNLPPCAFDGGAVLVERKGDLPTEASLEIERLFAPIGGIAEAGTFFESSDAATTDAPSARFIRAYHIGDVWIIWFERGGVGLSAHTVALEPETDESTGKQVLRAAPGSSFQGDLCAGSKAFVAGARSAG